jgi:hypothetical protein
MRSHGSDRDEPADADAGAEYRAVVERYESSPNQCTIMPVESVEDRRTTVWITATSPNFVDLREYR